MIDSFQRRLRRQPAQDGFTLIELLVVIIILGILAAVVVFAVGGVGDKGQNAATNTDLDTIRTAQEVHCAQFGTYATEAELVNAGLLAEQSTITDVVLNRGGKCGASTGAKSQYLLTLQETTEDTLTVGVNPQSSTADFTGGFTGTPAGVKNNFGMGPTNTNMFENLVRMTPDFALEPHLAERWEVPGSFGSVNPNAWRFHLRQGVTFHDGAEMTSADVVYTFNNRIAANSTLGVLAGAATAVSTYVVDVNLSFNNQRFLEQLTHHQTGAVLRNNSVPRSSSSAVPTPVGTGPFKFSSYSQGNELVLVRHDAYWGPSAKLATLTFKFIADVNTRLLALQSGQLDMMFDVPATSLASVNSTAGLKTAISPPGFNEVMWINSHRLDDAGTATVREDALSDLAVTTAPLNNGNRVRKALAAAIDRQSIINTIYPSGAVTANSIVPAAVLDPYASKIAGPTFDQAEAAEQLDAAGWLCPGGVGTTCAGPTYRTKAGATLTVDLLNGYTPTSLRGDSDILVENALEAVGIDVVRTRLNDTQQAAFDTEMSAGTADIYMERISQNDANPASPPSAFFDCGGGSGGTSPPVGTGVGTGGTCPNSSLSPFGYSKWFADNQTAFASTLAQARAATTNDDARRLTAEAMHFAIDDYVVGIHLGSLNSLFGMKADVQGFLLHGSLRQVRWGSVYRLS
ncbi:MAG: ABC transporter substrate-binding protein [Acidimicrobiales bacterium]